MEISEHYPEFKKNTIIIVTNNELVRIFSAHGRHIEDKKVLQLAAELQNKKSDNAKSPAPDIDEIKNQKRLELYKNLNDELMIFANDDDLEIILCVPEANKNILVDSLHPDVKKRITHFVSKNLASLNIEQIVRILQENKG